MTEETMHEMYELAAIAKYEDRYVIPSSHREDAANQYLGQGTGGFDFMEACSGCSITPAIPGDYKVGDDYWGELNG